MSALQMTFDFANEAGGHSLATAFGSAVRRGVQELQDGSALFLAHSRQIIFYDRTGDDLFGWHVDKQYAWVVTGTQPPPEALMKRMMHEYFSQNVELSCEASKPKKETNTNEG